MIVCFSPGSDGAVLKVVWLSCGLVLPGQTEHVGLRRESWQSEMVAVSHFLPCPAGCQGAKFGEEPLQWNSGERLQPDTGAPQADEHHLQPSQGAATSRGAPRQSKRCSANPCWGSVGNTGRWSTCHVLPAEQRSCSAVIPAAPVLGSVLQSEEIINILALCDSNCVICWCLCLLINSPCLSLEGDESFSNDWQLWCL